jgi:hypothetical protein
MVLEPVYLLPRVAFVLDETARLQRVDELLGLELRALQSRDDGGPELALPPNVARGSQPAKSNRELAPQLFQVDVFGKHYPPCRAANGFLQSKRHGYDSDECTRKPSTESSF